MINFLSVIFFLEMTIVIVILNFRAIAKYAFQIVVKYLKIDGSRDMITWWDHSVSCQLDVEENGRVFRWGVMLTIGVLIRIQDFQESS